MDEKLVPVASAPVEIEAIECLPKDWTASVAAKKVVWALSNLGVSVSLAPSFSPAITSAIDKLSAFLTPYGISISIDQAVFDKSLPFLLFAFLVVAHDYLKTKTNIKWL